MQEEFEEINPFVVNKPIDVIEIRSTTAFTASHDVSQGVNMRADKLSKVYLLDQAEKTSVYHHPYYKIDEILYGVLTPKARDLFLYIQYHLKKDQDWINLRLVDVRKVTGISRNSIVTGLAKLKAVGIITPKSQSVYWINPMYIFNGNRIRYYEALGSHLINKVSTLTK